MKYHHALFDKSSNEDKYSFDFDLLKPLLERWELEREAIKNNLITDEIKNDVNEKRDY